MYVRDAERSRQPAPDANVDVNSRTVGLFIAIGAVVFVCSLVPWWSRRRVTTVVR